MIIIKYENFLTLWKFNHKYLQFISIYFNKKFQFKKFVCILSLCYY